MSNYDFGYENDYLKYNKLEDNELIRCYVRELIKEFKSLGVMTNNDYNFCTKIFNLSYEYYNKSIIDMILDTEVKYICRYIISDLNQYIEQDLGKIVTKDELTKIDELLFSDNISKMVLGNKDKVLLSKSINDMHYKGLIYGSKYFLIDNFSIAIRILNCELTDRIISNEGTDIRRQLNFKYCFSFNNDIKNKVFCLISR